MPSSLNKPAQANRPSSWYAVYTRHQHEKTVARNLTTKGFETLLPLYQVRRRWQDRVKWLTLPLFPCYVFVRGNLERRLDIITTPGLHTFVLSAGQPASIPPAEIDAIRQSAESGVSVEPHPFLKSGEWVRVKSGPLEGIQGMLVRKKSQSLLVLSVAMLGKSAAVEIDAFEVERLTRPYGNGIRNAIALSTL